VLTSAEGKRLAAEKDAERIAKAQKKKEAERIRKEKEVARDQQRRARHPDEPFVGSLASKIKADLQEIAGALSLSEDGTKDALIQRINSFFESNPSHRNSPRFSGLFCRVQKRGPQETEDTHPIASTSQDLLHVSQPLAGNIVNLPIISNSHTYDNFFATLRTTDS
jgi:hypothetical protein